MTKPVLPGEPAIPTPMLEPPPMPSIASSALLESRRLLGRARRAVATWLSWD